MRMLKVCKGLGLMVQNIYFILNDVLIRLVNNSTMDIKI